MSAIAEKVKIVPLYVYDGAWKKEDGTYCGALTIITKPTYEIGAKTIGDVSPYGGNFPDYEEAKVYAKLFAAAPDLLKAVRNALMIQDLWSADQFGTVTPDIEGTKKALQAMQDELQAAFDKATTL